MPRPYQIPPDNTEYAPSYAGYVNLVTHNDVLQALERQVVRTEALLRSLPPEAALQTYEPGKWTLNQVVGHMIDAERIFAYRALRFARGDRSPLHGFDQEPYARESGHEERTLTSLMDEFVPLRRSHLLLLQNLKDAAWLRDGTASNSLVTVRAMAWILAGHELHHVKVIREKYLWLAGASA